MVNIENILRRNSATFYEKYPKFVTSGVTKVLQKILHEDEINEFLQRTESKNIPFVEKILEEKNVSFEVKSREVENIPAMGRVVIIANHPLGAMDAFALLKLVSQARTDGKVRIVANEILMHIEPIKDLLIPVNNMEGKLSKERLNTILEALNNEEAVIFFPAGEVSRASVTGVKDEHWKSGFLKLARSANAPILPIFIDAKNSWSFYFFSSMYKNIGTLLLSHEMCKPRFKDIRFRIGELIPHSAFSSKHVTLKEYTKLFKKHLYRLAKNKAPIFVTQKCIAHPQQRQLLKAELKRAKLLGATKDEKKIYLLSYDDTPYLMEEIGRLREFSFRKVGEGTGKRSDIDQYDKYYKHLLLWDEDALEVVGAYRLGEAKDIVALKGTKGLYMHELAHIQENFLPNAPQTVELGRSFIQPKYWGSRALDYLWQGIGAYLHNYPEVRYLYGPVSISVNYPKAARDALVYYYRHYYGTKNPMFTARTPYSITSHAENELDLLFKGNNRQEDFSALKEYLKNFDVTIPTLYKQYTELFEVDGVHFTDFGIDDSFGECVDGYIYVDLTKMKEQKKSRYLDIKSAA